MNFSYKLNIINRVIKSILLNQKPNYAIIYIDGRCNMKCGFCIHAAVDARKTPILDPDKWANFFRNANSLMHLTITGGEPFLRKDFFEIIDKILSKNKIPQVSINSNGFYIDRIKDFMPRLIDKHKNTEFTLSISLDGPEEIHDKVRVFKGAYKKALETIDAMCIHRNKSNFYLKLASVLTKDNNHFMENFLGTTSKWNIDFLKLDNFKAGAGCMIPDSKEYNALGLSYNLADIEYAKKIALQGCEQMKKKNKILNECNCEIIFINNNFVTKE